MQNDFADGFARGQMLHGFGDGGHGKSRDILA
jgi:hypothetical protein